jgi:hypothetical protein
MLILTSSLNNSDASILPNPGGLAKFCLFAARRSRYTPPREFMNEEAAKRAPMLTLQQVVDRYHALSPGFTRVALSAFGFTQDETQNLFNTLDEDYHISRFLHFSNKEGKSYLISGTEVTHVSIDATIQSIL